MIGHDIIYNHPMNHGGCLGRAALREILESACVLSFESDALPCERRPSPVDDGD